MDIGVSLQPNLRLLCRKLFIWKSIEKLSPTMIRLRSISAPVNEGRENLIETIGGQFNCNWFITMVIWNGKCLKLQTNENWYNELDLQEIDLFFVTIVDNHYHVSNTSFRHVHDVLSSLMTSLFSFYGRLGKAKNEP